MTDLFEKYDVPAPRYTSYPTVPAWTGAPPCSQWVSDLQGCAAEAGTTWSIYIHLPFCENQCAFCACNTIPTHDHGLEEPYLSTVIAELELYLRRVPALRRKAVRQIHIGGGTPTFFSAAHLERLLAPFYRDLAIDAAQLDASIEVNPAAAVRDQLVTLRGFGFSRISLGVQDFDPAVQAEVNRLQPWAVTERCAAEARALGFTSVNFDLIYGLPAQTPESMRRTAEITVGLRPDRIALYSLALVPWLKPAHKRLSEAAPRGADKRRLYEICRNAFLAAGYTEIGMDHFALPEDSLARAAAQRTLHRNFMGYTDVRTDLAIALGVSAISQSPNCYHQNEKQLEAYQQRISRGEFATLAGHVLSPRDKVRQRQILELMTAFEAVLEDEAQARDVTDFLRPLREDGLAAVSDGRLRLTEAGRPFLRNACTAFDEYLRAGPARPRIFSQAV